MSIGSGVSRWGPGVNLLSVLSLVSRWIVPVQSIPGLRVQWGKHCLLLGLRGLQSNQTLQTIRQGKENLWRVYWIWCTTGGKYEMKVDTSDAFSLTVQQSTDNYFVCPTGKSGPCHQSSHQEEHGAAWPVVLWLGPGQNIHPNGERLLPSVPQILHVHGAQQKGQDRLKDLFFIVLEEADVMWSFIRTRADAQRRLEMEQYLSPRSFIPDCEVTLQTQGFTQAELEAKGHIRLWEETKLQTVSVSERDTCTVHTVHTSSSHSGLNEIQRRKWVRFTQWSYHWRHYDVQYLFIIYLFLS